MDADIHIILDEKMTSKEKGELFTQIARIVHNEWWDQFSCSMIGSADMQMEVDSE
jgi:hypothetical protein